MGCGQAGPYKRTIGALLLVILSVHTSPFNQAPFGSALYMYIPLMLSVGLCASFQLRIDPLDRPPTITWDRSRLYSLRWFLIHLPTFFKSRSPCWAPSSPPTPVNDSQL